jgi:hypothetical protein
LVAYDIYSAGENHTPTARGTDYKILTTANGASGVSERLKISGDGTTYINGNLSTTGTINNINLNDSINILQTKTQNITADAALTTITNRFETRGSTQNRLASADVFAITDGDDGKFSELYFLVNSTEILSQIVHNFSNGLITNKINNLTPIGGVFSQTSGDIVVQNTNQETSITSTGQGSLLFPANTFKAGDNFHLKCSGNIETDGKDEQLLIQIKLGSTVIHSTTFIDLDDVKDLYAFELEMDFSFRTVGTNANIQSNSQFTYLKANDSNDYRGWSSNTASSVNSTTNLTLSATATWASADASNILQIKQFLLTIN